MPEAQEPQITAPGDTDPVEEFMNLDHWPLSPGNDDDFNGNGNDAVGHQTQNQSSASAASRESYMVGFIIVNVVGLQYYNGTINGREMVGLVREPLNAYDENAIKVLNTRSIQVGHIERASARVLAPMIDSHLITVEGNIYTYIRGYIDMHVIMDVNSLLLFILFNFFLFSGEGKGGRRYGKWGAVGCV